MQRASAILAAAILGTAGPALGDGLEMEPGKWEFRTTSSMPTAPRPMEFVDTRCVTPADTKPETFMKDASQCQVTSIETSARLMRWKVTCQNPTGPVVGEGEARSTGKTVRTTMKTSLEVDGQRVTMETLSEGRWLGPCD